MDDHISPKDALAVSLWAVRLTGAWIADISSPRLRLIYNLYGIAIMSFFTLAYFITEIIYVTMIWGDLRAIVETLFLLLTHIANSVKLVNLLIRRKRIEKLVADTCQTKFLPRNIDHENFIKATIRRAHRDNILFCLMCASTVMAWAIVPLMAKNELRRLPLKGWFPFDTTGSPIFELTYIYQIIAAEINACVHAMLDTFASVLMALAGAQLDILCYDLSNLNSDEIAMFEAGETGNLQRKSKVVKSVEKNKVKGKLLNEDEGVQEFPSAEDDILQERIIGCIEHHRAIIRFAREIQDVFGIGILTQFAVSSIILCLTCFELTLISPASLHFYSMLLYQGCMLFQIYCYCWHGNGIIVKTSELMTAAFHCQWTPCSPKFKNTLHIMMCRMQRPMKLMVGGLFGLSLETFSMILRSAYSFYALIKRVHNGGN